MERRLTAIVAADIVDYSLLLRMDEAATLATLSQIRYQLIEPALAALGGRIFRLMGDGSLFEFSSALSAVQFAVGLQQAMAERKFDVAPSLSLQFRMGLDLGDVVVDGVDIHGDGVNVAARLESMAPPGGILVSYAIYSQIKGPLAEQFLPIGERYLKNVAEPVPVWRWPAPGQASRRDASGAKAWKGRANGRQILAPVVTDLILELHMRSARLAVSDAFDEILALPDGGRSLGLEGIYQRIGAELNRARNMLRGISVETVVGHDCVSHWQSPCIMSEFISNVFDNAATAYASIMLPKIQTILRSNEPPTEQRRQFMALIKEFMREDMLPQVKRHIKFAFVED